MNDRGSRAERLFRRLLRLFPAEFRGDYGDDMAATFRDQRRAVLARDGRIGALQLWWATLGGILTTAPREHLDLLRGDLRYALRGLRRNPAFTLVAVVALAVGIGANTAVFTIVNGVLLRALPYRDPGALVAIFEKLPGAPVPKFDFSAPDFAYVRRTARAYAGMFAYRNQTLELSGIGEPQRVVGARVSPEMFGVLGVAPVLGRALTPEDDRLNARVAILGDGLWRRAFGRDPAIVGKTIALDRQPYTIVGVMGDRFEFPPRGSGFNLEPASVFLPIAFTAAELEGWSTGYNNTLVARLAPGVTIVQARDELASLTPSLIDQYPAVLKRDGGFATRITLPISPFIDEVVGESRRMILVLMGAVGLVLLIGCADVANLMLTRAGARQRELSVRSALGASPARVVRQLVTEGLVLAAIGGVAGVLLAWWTVQAMLTLAGDALPRIESIAFDRGVVLFTAVLSLLTPLIFGVVPAIRAALGSTAEALRDGARTTGAHRRHRLLGALVVAQFALALMLSVGAGLLVRSFIRLLSASPGFRAEQVVTASVQLPSGRYVNGQQVKTFYHQAVEAMRTIPGVTAAAASTDRPLHIQERRTFTPDATAVRMPTMNRVIAASWATGNYFQALGIPLRAGRFLTDEDGLTQARVVVISEMLARTMWPNQDPVGHQIKWGIDESRLPWMTIVGVVGDVNQSALGTDIVPQTYEPTDQQGNGAANFYRRVNLIARATGDASAALGAIRAAVHRLDPALPVADATTVLDVVNESVKPQRFSMTVVGGFALVALALAAIGIYGVLTNAVTQQTHEIGVRMALGATAADVMWSVLRRALILMAIGVALGTAGALALARLVAALLYEIRPTDGVTFAGAALLLALLAVVASLVPAWRATRVDPLIALRAE
jgi:putative ABC transport system permease protein